MMLRTFEEFVADGTVKKQSPNVIFVNELRYYRNGIKYYGKKFNMEYAQKVLLLMNKLYLQLNHSITHIWFDLEGTLLKNPAYDAAVEDFAYQLYIQETGKQRSAETKKEFDALLKQHVRKSLIFVALGKSKKFYAEAFAAQFPFQNYVTEDTDVQAVISFLKQKKIGLGVYTSLPRDPLIKIISLLGLNPSDFTLLSGDDVKKGKPDPEGFEKIVQICAVPSEQIIFVGDSELKDIIPAKRVGMQTILVRGSCAVADFSFFDFKELLCFFQKHL